MDAGIFCGRMRRDVFYFAGYRNSFASVSGMTKTEKYVVRTSDIPIDRTFHFSHPLNSASEMRLLPLSDQTGMKNLGISIGRIPPGKEGFIPHAHAGQEEFIYVLEGEGVLTVDGETTVIKPGDFVGFPIDGAVHHLANDAKEDLVYLMGGERTATDVSYFPTIGKKGFWANGTMHYVDDDDAASFRPDDFSATKS